MTKAERSPSERTEDVLHFLVQRSSGLWRTVLVKLAYLADVEAHRYLGRSITGLSWKVDRHGPFDTAFFSAAQRLEQENAILHETIPIPNNTVHRYYPAPSDRSNTLTEAERTILLYVLRAYGDIELQSLLEDVVYETTPFKAVENQAKGTLVPLDMVNNEGVKKLGGIRVEDVLRGEREAREGKTIELHEWLRKATGSS